MAKKAAKKRYADRAAALLADVVRAAELDTPPRVRGMRDVLSKIVNAHEGAVFVDPKHDQSIASWSIAELERQKLAIRQFLTSIVTLRDVGEGNLQSIRLDCLEFSLIPIPGVRNHKGTDILLRLDGDTGDLVWFGLINLIRAAGVDRLQFCSAPDCEQFHGRRRIYARVGRREFCSTRCQKRIYMREKYDPK
jgi:hypothetical protein